MKKKNWIIVGVLLLLVFMAVLGGYNRFKQNDGNETYVTLKLSEKEKIQIPLEEVNKVTFDGMLKKKVGEPEKHEFKGIFLYDLLEENNVDMEKVMAIYIVSEDNYKVELTKEEIREKDNVYLAAVMDGAILENLDKDGESPMLVIKNDAFSTRWAKCVQTIQVLYE